MVRKVMMAACLVAAGCSAGHRNTTSSPTGTTTSVPTSSDLAAQLTLATSSSNPAPSGALSAVSCPRHAYRPESSDLADEVSAINTSCATATSVVAAAPDRPNAGRPYRAMGFSCVPGPEVQPPGGGMSHVPYRCEDGHGAVVTFDRF